MRSSKPCKRPRSLEPYGRRAGNRPTRKTGRDQVMTPNDGTEGTRPLAAYLGRHGDMEKKVSGAARLVLRMSSQMTYIGCPACGRHAAYEHQVEITGDDLRGRFTVAVNNDARWLDVDRALSVLREQARLIRTRYGVPSIEGEYVAEIQSSADPKTDPPILRLGDVLREPEGGGTPPSSTAGVTE